MSPVVVPLPLYYKPFISKALMAHCVTTCVTSTHEKIPAFTPQPQGVTALWLVLI